MAKVLHVTECFDGGTGRAIVSRVRATPEHEHHLLWTGSEAPPAEVSWASCSKLPRGFLARIRHVRREVANLRPDVVHAHSSWAGVYTRITRLSAPIVYEAHCFKFEDPRLPTAARGAVRLIESGLARRTAAIGVLSPYEALLTKSFWGDASVVEIPNLPTVQLQPDGAKNERSSYVSMVGRISDQKDPRMFIEVKRAVEQVLPDVRFRWIGDGDAKLRAELELNGVETTGWIAAAEVQACLRDTSVYLHTAAYEGFPLSVLDAAASRTPIVIRRIPSMQHAGLQMGDSATQLAGAVIEMFQEPRARARAATANIELLRKMSPEALKRSLNTLYIAAVAP